MPMAPPEMKQIDQFRWIQSLLPSHRNEYNSHDLRYDLSEGLKRGLVDLTFSDASKKANPS